MSAATTTSNTTPAAALLTQQSTPSWQSKQLQQPQPQSQSCEGDACSLKPKSASSALLQQKSSASATFLKQNSSSSSTTHQRGSSEATCSVYSPICQQVASASLGAMITSLCMTPLDVIRTRLQVQHKQTATSSMATSAARNYYYTGTFDAISKISKGEGVRGLWRGLTPSLAMQIPASGIYYSLYEALKDKYNTQFSSHISPAQVPLFAGFTARIFTAIISTPFEYIRTMIQSQTINWRASFSKLEWRNLFTGTSATVLRDAPFSAIYWFSYEYIKQIQLQQLLNIKQKHKGSLLDDPQVDIEESFAMTEQGAFLRHFTAGAVSGTIAATVTTPIDVIKTRIQASETEKKRIMSTMLEIYREDGMAGFARGLIPRVTKVAPSCAIMISTYELMKKLFEERTKQ